MIVTDASGRPLDAPLDVEAEVAWVGYANGQIRAQIEPLLQAALRGSGGWGRLVMEAAGLAAFVETLRARRAVRARGAGLRSPVRRDGST